MNKPTTTELIKFLREEAITMELAQCDSTYLVIAAADRLELAIRLLSFARCSGCGDDGFLGTDHDKCEWCQERKEILEQNNE